LHTIIIIIVYGGGGGVVVIVGVFGGADVVGGCYSLWITSEMSAAAAAGIATASAVFSRYWNY
jgi:hypothetical protein